MGSPRHKLPAHGLQWVLLQHPHHPPQLMRGTVAAILAACVGSYYATGISAKQATQYKAQGVPVLAQ